MTDKADPRLLFDIFKEIGIIEQLSRALLEVRLPSGLIAPHFAVLNHLINRGDGAVPIEMARAFQVPKTTMTHTLKGLVAHGLIDLRANADDGRSKRVWLTPKGRQMRDDVIAAMAPEFSKLTAGFDVDMLTDIKPTLIALRQYLDDARNG